MQGFEVDVRTHDISSCCCVCACVRACVRVFWIARWTLIDLMECSRRGEREQVGVLYPASSTVT